MATTCVWNSARISPARMRFSMSGLTQYFRPRAHFRAAMDDRDMGSGAKEIQRGFGGGVPSSDHGHVLLPIRVRFGEVVGDVREIFAAHAEKIRMIVESRGDHDFSAVILMRLRLRIHGVDDEGSVVAGDAFDALVLVDFEFKVLDGATIIFQRFDAAWACRRRQSWAARRFPCAREW